ncbi:MAG: IPT/TIG domain-containing protein [Pedobacter sp.]
MKNKIIRSVLVTSLLVFCAVTIIWAATPPPPVNQYLGFYDTKFAALTTTADCLVCHVSHEVLVPRHHALITTKGMACLDCHTIVSDGSGGFTFVDYRTCSNCHVAAPHHVSAKAAAQDCVGCHGAFIDNPLDGHYVPTSAISSITPLPGGRIVTDNAGNSITVQGCRACHQASPTAIDPATNTVRIIYSNADTHHGTNIGNTGAAGSCLWCHNIEGTTTMRKCESCHGVKSLHNIQKKSSPDATITPGSEIPGNGHIGADWDCIGCHWSWTGSSSDSPATIIVPALRGQSSYTLVANKAISLTLTGAAFTNVDSKGAVYNPTVTISNATTSLSLTPFLFSDSEIQVAVPALQAGIYNLIVTKQGVASNLAKLTVVPELAITAAVGSNGTATITGTGFGSSPPTDYKSGLGVFVGQTQTRILSWSDSKIVASSNMLVNGAAVTVKTLNGAISKVLTVATKKSR